MIPRPTTDVLIRDCCRELTDEILPVLPDDTLKVRLIMTMTVLSNAAVRAANEIAWMRDETQAMLDFARDVAQARPDDTVTAALAAAAAGPRDSLRLKDVVDVYESADRAFDAAQQAAQQAGAQEFIDRAGVLLRARIETEKQVMADYAVVGR